MNDAGGELRYAAHVFETQFTQLRNDVTNQLGDFREQARTERAELRADLRRIYERLDARPCETHKARLDELDSFRRHFWSRVVATVAAVTGIVMGLVTLLRDLLAHTP